MSGEVWRRVMATSGTWLVLAGAAVLAFSGISLVRTYLYQRHSAAVLDRERLRPRVDAINNSPRQGALLGSMSIPRVGVSSVIVEGSDDHDLALSVGHIPGTAVPGQDGNVGLAGHRDTFFRGLQNIRAKDDIVLSSPGGTRVYEVESTSVVSPEDVYVLNDIGRPLLTLVTCYPFHYLGHAPKRFIVQARLIGDKEFVSRTSRLTPVTRSN